MILLRLVSAMLLVTALSSRADEGMSLFNSPPLKQHEEKYQFEPTPQWLEHLQKSSVRFNSGGSGSFVSATGLCITNHHVGADALQKASSEQHNYLKEGFYAKTNAEEVKCADLELNVLISIEDVTAQVNAAVKTGMPPDTAGKARENAIAQIEKESKDKTGLRSDVVTLYQGGAYHLYRYKRYDDVRLVFAPEQQIAFYGGDPDNFEYPRYDLDVCIFRVYESGQPAKIDNFLKWNSRGPSDGELTFLTGSPGKTDRQLTVDELADTRDRWLPYLLRLFNRREVLELAYGARSFENARKTHDDLFGDQNNRKRYDGYLAGLLDPQIWAQLQAREQKLRDAIARDPKLRSTAGAYDRIKNAQAEIAKNAPLYNYLEQERPIPVGYRGPRAFFGNLFEYARLLLRAVDERTKPNGERIPQFRDSALDSLELELFSSEPIYDDYETLRLTDSLTDFATQFGADDPLVKKVLGGKSPHDRAVELVSGTKLTDFAGLYQRSAEHDNRPPFDLPKRWVDKKASLNLATHFNFVSDADIIGGNSGSPVVNRANEFVGIIFDGNIQSLVLDCIYTDTQARAVSVDSAAIIEALRKVYDAQPLADELEGVRK